MIKFYRCFSRIFGLVSAGMLVGTFAMAANMAPNPRASGASVGRDGRDTHVASPKKKTSGSSRTAVARHAASGAVINSISGRGTVTGSASRGKQQNRNVVSTQRMMQQNDRSVARTAAPTAGRQDMSRSAAVPFANYSAGGRASMARATALFDDTSKIGGGYSECRDSYATCMDQFCGKANETYRRCFCSSRFLDFRDTEEALDQAKVLLQAFEDNNLNAVDKTAAEVNAMYTASVGEAAIKNDTSGAQSILNEIGDLLAGKKKTSTSGAVASTSSLGVMSLDFSTDIGNIWGGGDGDVFGSNGTSIFSGGGSQDVSGLEGAALYNAVDKQCQAMVAQNCESTAAFNMSKSSYGILISQDCNAYEKSVKSKREQVMQVVRQAEKILRQARLENYRAHNSQDVNECLDRVKSAMLVDTACGTKYKRCLDFTGAYINQTTGEPIYSQRLFQLTELIELNGTDGDVIRQNTTYSAALDNLRNRAASALDSCQGIADTVWSEFKRVAIIEIAQAQDEKIEEVKSTCVQTMKECYDTQADSLKALDTTKGQVTGALQAYTTKAMCEDKVIACASLYGDTTGCKFDGNGKLVSGNGIDSAGRCGLTELLAYVDRVDNVRVAEGCSESLNNHINSMCAPVAGDEDHEYPWGCRTRTIDNIKTEIVDFALRNCVAPGQTIAGNTADEKLAKLGKLLPEVHDVVNNAVKSISKQITEMMREECYSVTENGTVIFDTTGLTFEGEVDPEVSVSPVWLKNVFGSEAELTKLANTGIYGYKLLLESGATAGSNINRAASTQNPKSLGYGVCTIPSIRQLCVMQAQLPNMSGSAKYDASKRVCNLTDEWYSYRCRLLGGYYVGSGDDARCYLKP